MQHILKYLWHLNKVNFKTSRNFSRFSCTRVVSYHYHLPLILECVCILSQELWSWLHSPKSLLTGIILYIAPYVICPVTFQKSSYTSLTRLIANQKFRVYIILQLQYLLQLYNVVDIKIRSIYFCHCHYFYIT